MVDRYATAVVLARRYNVSNPAVTRAIRRLAFHTDIIGEAKMKQYTSGVKDLELHRGHVPAHAARAWSRRRSRKACPSRCRCWSMQWRRSNAMTSAVHDR